MAELIAALDLPETDQILSMAGTLRGIVPWCKVGMEAFVLAGPDIIAKLSDMGFRVFLDLKFYDIPNTVAQAVRAGVKRGAEDVRGGHGRGRTGCFRRKEAVHLRRDRAHELRAM